MPQVSRDVHCQQPIFWEAEGDQGRKSHGSAAGYDSLMMGSALRTKCVSACHEDGRTFGEVHMLPPALPIAERLSSSRITAARREDAVDAARAFSEFIN